MRILSLTAASRLAERLVRQAGGQLPRHELLARLEALEVDHERAAAGARLAVVVGRLEPATDAEGLPVLALPKAPERRTHAA